MASIVEAKSCFQRLLWTIYFSCHLKYCPTGKAQSPLFRSFIYVKIINAKLDKATVCGCFRFSIFSHIYKRYI